MSTVTRITKAVLATDLATARARVFHLEGQLIAERAMHALALVRAGTVAPAAGVVAAPVKPAIPQWQADRVAAMALARAMAMRSGTMVKM